MPNPIDLCTVTDVRLYLGLGLTSDPGPGVVNTSIAASITAGTRTVTPGSMDSIAPGTVLDIDTGTVAELVIVTATTDTTFTATFSANHIGPVAVASADKNGMADVLFGSLITSASMYLMWRTGNMPNSPTAPTQSPFTQQVQYTQWYDGNGNDRLFLRNTPIISVSSLQVCGVTVPPSTGWGSAGYMIDDSGKCLVFQGSNNGVKWMRGQAGYPAYGAAAIYGFSRGTQNIKVVYTAGYSITPYDLKDACVQLIGFNFRRRDWIGMKQVTKPQSEGVVTYAYDWVTTPFVEEVIRHYTRRSYS